MNRKTIALFIVLFTFGNSTSFIISGVDIKGNDVIDGSIYKYFNTKNKEYNPFFMTNPPVDLDPYGLFDSKKPMKIETPEYFNWREYLGQDWTTPARAQGWCGSCWDFAAIGIIESAINIKEGCSYLDPDLSEQYVLSCLPKSGRCFGGTCTSALKYIIDTSENGNYVNGIIPESCFPYRAIDPLGCDCFDCVYEPVLCSEKCENWMDYLIPLVGYEKWHSDPEDNELIKAQIMESGPIAVPMYVIPELTYWLMTHHDPDEYFAYPGEVHGTNHEINIVGWKDDPSINNGGYWICKNSWGVGFGYDGFFNIEYGSLNVDDSKVVYVIYDPDSYNWPPVANTDGPYYGSVGEEITLNADASFDVEGEIISYNWDLGEGTVLDGEIVTHIYSEKGIYPIILNLTDENGTIGSDSTWAFIDETNISPEKPVIKGPTKCANRTLFNYTFFTNDPENDDIYYYIDWGDGFVDEWIGPFSSASEIKLKHYWYFKGKYTIRAKAKDIYGNEGEWSSLKINIPKYKKSFERPDHGLISNLIDNMPILRFIFSLIIFEN